MICDLQFLLHDKFGGKISVINIEWNFRKRESM